jgi:hypothetical protein
MPMMPQRSPIGPGIESESGKISVVRQHFGVSLFFYMSVCVLLCQLLRSHVWKFPGWNRGMATACPRNGHAFEPLQTQGTAVGQQQGGGGSSDAG